MYETDNKTKRGYCYICLIHKFTHLESDMSGFETVQGEVWEERGFKVWHFLLSGFSCVLNPEKARCCEYKHGQNIKYLKLRFLLESFLIFFSPTSSQCLKISLRLKVICFHVLSSRVKEWRARPHIHRIHSLREHWLSVEDFCYPPLHTYIHLFYYHQERWKERRS